MKIAQGAEAILYRKDGELIKERVKKNYRIQHLDEKLRFRRTRLEANLLREARRVGVATPQVIDVYENTIKMEFISGNRVKEILSFNNYEEIGKKIGLAVAKLHEFNIIHGDLTTSNMILRDDEMYFIDFGLGFHSSKIEDKAVDLYLLFHALESTHWQLLEKVWTVILSAYKNYKDAERVIKTFHEIKKRGRYVER